jgi:hypothetical protein
MVRRLVFNQARYRWHPRKIHPRALNPDHFVFRGGDPSEYDGVERRQPIPDLFRNQ